MLRKFSQVSLQLKDWLIRYPLLYINYTYIFLKKKWSLIKILVILPHCSLPLWFLDLRSFFCLPCRWNFKRMHSQPLQLTSLWEISILAMALSNTYLLMTLIFTSSQVIPSEHQSHISRATTPELTRQLHVDILLACQTWNALKWIPYLLRIYFCIPVSKNV